MMIDMSGMAEFGALIKRAREQRGLTVVDLGNRLGRTHTFVVRLETAKNTNPPDPQTMRDLERILGVSRRQMLEALGYLDPPNNANVITIPASDPRAAILRLLDGETDAGVRNATRLFANILEYSRGDMDTGNGVSSAGQGPDKPDAPTRYGTS